jgi:hypothetical protein
MAAETSTVLIQQILGLFFCDEHAERAREQEPLYFTKPKCSLTVSTGSSAVSFTSTVAYMDPISGLGINANLLSDSCVASSDSFSAYPLFYCVFLFFVFCFCF